VQRNIGFVKAVVWAFAFVMLFVTWEVTGSEVSRVEFSDPPAEVETYDFAEIVIRVTDPDVANPFTDASVEGHFAQEGSEPVAVDGFCDSTDGSVFRIRFMPSRPGRHEYSVTYRQQGLERTQTGSFHAVASGRKGCFVSIPKTACISSGKAPANITSGTARRRTT
jgi:hypothetical protein